MRPERLGPWTASSPHGADTPSKCELGSAAPLRDRGPARTRVVLLTNFIPPYRLPLLEALATRVLSLTVLVSTRMERNRSWRPETGHLDVRVQRTLSFRRTSWHPAGFSDATYVHVPVDTWRQLRALRPDVVVSAELGFRSLASALYCLGRRRPKLIIWATLSERTEEGRGITRRLLRRWLLRRADGVVVNGASGMRYVRTSALDRPASCLSRTSPSRSLS